MLAGMIAPEKPPMRIANSASSFATLRVLKFGPFVRSPPDTWPSGLEPWEAAALSVWQPLQRSANSCAPCSSADESTLISSVSQPVRMAPAIRAAARARLRLMGRAYYPPPYGPLLAPDSSHCTARRDRLRR